MTPIYLDSSIVIYLVERHPQYAVQIESALAATGDAELATSKLVALEVLAKPLLEGKAETVALYQSFLAAMKHLPVTDAIFDRALKLRVRHWLKTADALHLALAQIHQCDQFWTNDMRLAEAAGTMNVDILSRPGP